MGCLGLSAILAQVSPRQPPPDPSAVLASVSRLRSGDFALVDCFNIALGGAVDAVPDLEKQFKSSDDVEIKDGIAMALVRLHSTNSIYWSFLVEQATKTIESDAPEPETFDSAGKINGQVSPEFSAWATSHDLPIQKALESISLFLPGMVLRLGFAGDSRAIPLLRKALLSPNLMTESLAAFALDELHDKQSIPWIIEACKKAPSQIAYALASALRDFDDLQAQAAAKVYAPMKQQP